MALSAFLLATGCSDESIFPEINPDLDSELSDETGEGFRACVPPYEFADGTRMNVSQTLDVINWSDGDKIGIYYEDGKYSATASFTVQKGGSSSGFFTNPGFMLMPSCKYYASYPYVEGSTAHSVPMNYWGQVQKGNGSTAHLGACNYMFGEAVSDLNGRASFAFKNYNAILKFELRVPESGTFTSLTVFSNKGQSLEYKSNYDCLRSNSSGKDYVNNYLLSFENGISLSAGDVLTAYLAIPPVDWSKDNLTLELATGFGKIYTAKVDGQLHNSGKAYRYIAEVTDEEFHQSVPEGLQAIDLGTSVLWANMNVGAESLTDPGYYFAFGERRPKENYYVDNYKHQSVYSHEILSPYFPSLSNPSVLLAPEDDAASVYFGENWRMPTSLETGELLHVGTFRSVVGGMEFSANNGNSVLFPYSGYKENTYLMDDNTVNLPLKDFSYGPSGSYGTKVAFRFGTRWLEPYWGVPVRAVYEPREDKEYVDLGLPSGTLWAKCNVGATYSGDLGGFFAWGDPTVKKKTNTSIFTYTDIYTDDNGKLTKYNWDSKYGLVDNLVTLDASDDAATVNWGKDWRLPTSEEIQELISECTWTQYGKKESYGCLVTGPSGNSIFIPLGNIENYRNNYDYLSNTLNVSNSKMSYTFYSNAYFSGFSDLFDNTQITSEKLRLESASRGHLCLARPVRVKKSDHQNVSGGHFEGDKDW